MYVYTSLLMPISVTSYVFLDFLLVFFFRFSHNFQEILLKSVNQTVIFVSYLNILKLGVYKKHYSMSHVILKSAINVILSKF